MTDFVIAYGVPVPASGCAVAPAPTHATAPATAVKAWAYAVPAANDTVALAGTKRTRVTKRDTSVRIPVRRPPV